MRSLREEWPRYNQDKRNCIRNFWCGFFIAIYDIMVLIKINDYQQGEKIGKIENFIYLSVFINHISVLQIVAWKVFTQFYYIFKVNWENNSVDRDQLSKAVKNNLDSVLTVFRVD